MRDLSRKHGQPSAVAPAAQLGKHFALLAARQTAHAEAFQHKRTVVRGQQRDNICPHTRHQPQHKHIGVQRGTEHRMGIFRRALQELDQAAGRRRKGISLVSRKTAVSG